MRYGSRRPSWRHAHDRTAPTEAWFDADFEILWYVAPLSFMSACTWCRWYILPCLACMRSRTAAACVAPLGPALWRAQPGSCRGPFGGCLRGRQHLHLHTLPCLHLHLPGTAHRPLHLHFFGRACPSPSRRDAPPPSASSARQGGTSAFLPRRYRRPPPCSTRWSP